MKAADQYHRFVRWSDEDQLYIGYCPDLYFGGVCHGESEEQVYAELCGVIRDEVAHREQSGETLPKPAVRVTRDVEMVAAMNHPPRFRTNPNGVLSSIDCRWPCAGRNHFRVP